MTISALQTEIVASALYEEMYKMQNVSEASGKDSTRIITDARHACRKNSYHTDVVAIGQVIYKVVCIQHVTKNDDVSSTSGIRWYRTVVCELQTKRNCGKNHQYYCLF